jgi:hypothetical protein
VVEEESFEFDVSVAAAQLLRDVLAAPIQQESPFPYTSSLCV